MFKLLGINLFIFTLNLQDAINFVKKEVLEEETKLIGIPAEGCSKIMLWNLHNPTAKNLPPITLPDSSQS